MNREQVFALLEIGFKAGWMASGEGYNGEWPDEGKDWPTSAGKGAFTEWIDQADPFILSLAIAGFENWNGKSGGPDE
jgi:hypothetical protein